MQLPSRLSIGVAPYVMFLGEGLTATAWSGLVCVVEAMTSRRGRWRWLDRFFNDEVAAVVVVVC